MLSDATIIAQTTAWIKSVVIDCNFCPFASKAMRALTIRYTVVQNANLDNTLETLAREMKHLDDEKNVETTLIILPFSFDVFSKYLDLVKSAENALTHLGYEGVYQIASFHPDYCFAGSNDQDAANYTNRSIYPMLHILREASVSQAVDHYPGAVDIPKQNIAYAQQKGLRYMQLLRAACMEP